MISRQLKQALSFAELTAQWLGAGGRPVPMDHAQRRANVCLQCPFNDGTRRIEEVLKTEVAMTVRRQLRLKNEQHLRVAGEKSLHLCAACDCVLRLKVFAPLKFIVENTDVADLEKKCAEKGVTCWILEEQKEVTK